MRKLASIQRIWKIESIEGADRIELAHVLGWQCVVNKGQFRPMDSCVYFAIDSFLPVCPEFEFLRSSSYKKTEVMGEGFRLRTMCFRGQISQGLLLPISQLSVIPSDVSMLSELLEKQLNDLLHLVCSIDNACLFCQRCRLRLFMSVCDIMII